MPDISDDPGPLPTFTCHPPEWLPKVHNRADLGYPNFHPPRPGQDEDILSEPNVKNGFNLEPAVAAETYSSQTSISDNLHSASTISKLEELMNEVFARRSKQLASVPPSTFRMPSRVTLNDAKRQAWFDDLANPNVPLHKLGKNVPHGAKGADLLEHLHSKNVAIPRAVWFLRVFGGNETAGLRNKPTFDPTQYSVEWTNVVTTHLRKQLQDIALPSAPRAGVNIKQTFKGVLSDPDTREKWVSRFSYCLKLLRSFYSEGLVNKRTFFVWVVNQMTSCNLAQAGFLTRLADEFLDGMMGCRALTRPFVEACLSKLSEICSTAAKEYLPDTENILKSLLQRMCLALPETFVSPRLWITYSQLLCDVLTHAIVERPADNSLEQVAESSIQQVLYCNYSDIKRRNETMLFRNLPSLASAHLGSAVHDVELLNSISADTDIINLPFFPTSFEDWSGIPEKLDTLLTWSVTPLQYGDHRPFAAVTLIRHWRTRAGDRANRRDYPPPDAFLQDQLFEWLDTSDIAGEIENIRAVALLFGKLVKHELFSYASYIQRLIARGEPGLSFNEETGSRHRNYLRWIPLHNSTASLTSQRKVVLYGIRARETPEDLNEREIRKEVRAVLPELFGGVAENTLPSTSSLAESCRLLLNGSRYEQVRTFRVWLMSILQKAIVRQEYDATHSSILKSYCVAVELMTQAKCFHTMLDLTLIMLEHCSTEELLLAVIDTFRRHAIIWASLDVKGTIISALNAIHRSWKMRGIQSRPLLTLLVDFDGGKYLSDAAREEVLADISAFTLALQPVTHHPDSVPDVLPEILLLAGDPALEAPSILANGLWIKYRMSMDWGWKVWDNTIASLRQIPAMSSETMDRRRCALRYGIFLYHVNRHLATGLDKQVQQWFLGPGKNEVAALTADVWDIVNAVLLYLVVQGALTSTTILEGLVYPAWFLVSSASNQQQAQSSQVYLHAANGLCRQLLLKVECNTDMVPPTNVLDVQCIRTRRHDVYREPHFPLLITNIPVLVSLENNPHVAEHSRLEARDMRQQLCEDELFRQGVYHNLDAVRVAFERSMQIAEGNENDLCQPTVAALSMILGEAPEELELSKWPDSASLLSPWKISATAIQLQFVLRQMGRNVALGTKGTTDAELDHLTSMIFHNTLSSEEANFVAQMTKGVGSEIAGKFINNGLKHVAEIIRDIDFASSSLAASLRRAGELLRVLIYVVEPLREESSDLPSLRSDIQSLFFEALSAKFAMIVELRKTDSALCSTSQLTQASMLFARFLQFNLAFQGVWTDKAKAASERLPVDVFALVQSHATGNSADLVAYPLLLDTLYYLIDEIPTESKMGFFDPFRFYPDIPLSSLSSNIPQDYRVQLQSILSEVPNITPVTDLENAHKDAGGNWVVDSVVLYRPWEWTENLGEPAAVEEECSSDGKQYLKGKEPVKNTGSLPLQLFGARATGESIFPFASQNKDARLENNLRSLEDGLSVESVFQRDWRETRVNLSAESLLGPHHGKGRSEHDHDMVFGPSAPGGLERGERRGTPRASPVSTSGYSRSSGMSIRHQSPGHSAFNRLSNSAASEIIDVDSLPNMATSRTGRPGKRKTSTDSDDEIIIVDGPAPVAKTTKKSKAGRTAAKKTTKKR